MVPANDVELTFRKPDRIASLTEEEITEKCKFNSDIYIFEGKDFYVRCILPLPVKEKGHEYCLGVWVQVSSNSFNRIWDLWDEKDISSEPLIKGLLANEVPLTEGSINSDVTIQLIGSESRPEVNIIDQNCSLHLEQTCGITIHRASEYSDLCR